MKTELIDPFLVATSTVINTMCQIAPLYGTPVIKQDSGTWGVVSGLIGMSSTHLSGNLIVSFDERAALSIVSKMLMETFQEINDEIVDAVGEITNMITGGAKQKFSEMGYDFNMATPIVVTGRGVKLVSLCKAPIIQVPFVVPGGGFVVEANLQDLRDE